MKRLAIDAEWIIKTLIGPGSITVERNGEIVGTKFGHN